MHEKLNWGHKQYPIIKTPTPHIVLNSFEKKPAIFARWNLKDDKIPKACTVDVLHLSPYKGCTVKCSFCSLPRFRGYNLLFTKHKVSIVFEHYDQYVDSEIEKADFLHMFDFGADADACMPLNSYYRLTEKTMAVLNKWGIPFTITTKLTYPDSIIHELLQNKNSWAQYSIFTLKNAVLKHLTNNTVSVLDIVANVKRVKKAGITVTARLQPYIPYISEPLEEIVPKLVDMGFDNIVFGLFRAPMSRGTKLLQEYSVISSVINKKNIDYTKLYSEKYPGYWQLPDRHSIMLVEKMRALCDKYRIKLGLCDIIVKKDGKFVSLQGEYGTEMSCECKNSHGYYKVNNVFKKVPSCIGNCLYCRQTNCGFPEFYDSVKYDIKKYQRLKYEKKS